MSNAIFSIDTPKNEPVLSYAPGSCERAELKRVLEEFRRKEIEIPLVIGGREIKTGNMGSCMIPHDHGHRLATYHKASAIEVATAVDAAKAAAGSWLRIAVAGATRHIQKGGGADGRVLQDETQRRHHALPGEKRHAGRDRFRLRTHRFLEIQLLLRDPDLQGSAGI